MLQGTSLRPFAWAIFQGGLLPALLFVVTCTTRATPVAAPTVEIHWLTDRASPAVEVSGVPHAILETFGGKTAPEQAGGFAVFAEQPGQNASAERPALPAMSGKWIVVRDRLRFEPRFPFEPGVRYRAEVRLGGDTPPVTAFLELPRESMEPTTRVEQIFPSVDVLPENQLKFYVQFSAPMSRGGVYDHIRVRDASRRIIELPFLELDEELWDPTMTRLTLLIDPGRIKRGVKPLEETGPVFEDGKEYSLTVDNELRDAGGRPLLVRHAKKFRVGPADRTPPDPKRWKLLPPMLGLIQHRALVVDFDEPMDRALALRMIRVVNAANQEIEGRVRIEDRERRWNFLPARPWIPGQYRLVVQTTIEDLAGNNIGKTFDVDVFEGVQRRLETETVSVAFEVR